MKSTSHLTNLERLIDATADIDVGPGYPEVALPEWLEDILLRPTREDLEFAYGDRRRFPVHQTEQLHNTLLKCVCRSLGIEEEHSRHGFMIHTGSFALERVLLSVMRQGESVLTANPSIDIVTAMALEQRGICVAHFPCHDTTFKTDVCQIEKALLPDTKAVVITSPENPTGTVFTEEQVKALIQLALDRDLTLIFDQCFALINPFDVHIPLIPNYASPDVKWVLCWDTGKTFGFKGDKLGFVFCSSCLSPQLQAKFNIVRFDVSRRLEIMFQRVLPAAMESGYFSYLSSIIRQNIEIIEEFVAHHLLPIRPIRPEAGGLMLLDVTRVKGASNDTTFVQHILTSRSLGLIKGTDFFYTDADGRKPTHHDKFVRIALARDGEVIHRVMDEIKQFCVEKP